MSNVTENKAVSRSWIEGWNAFDRAAEAAARAPEFVAHVPTSLEPKPLGSQAWGEFEGAFRQGFPDMQITIEATVAEGDLVAQRVRFEGTHTGFFQGLPPTGRSVSLDGMEFNLHGPDGRVVEHWVQMDALGLLQQLGVAVVPGPRLLARILVSPLTRLRMKSKS